MNTRHIDLVGQRFGKLQVMARAGRAHGYAAWECQCDCGGSKIVASTNLQKGSTTSCGCKQKHDLTDRRFGKLLVIGEDGLNKSGNYKWKVVCDCGEKFTLDGSTITTGRVTKCPKCSRKSQKKQPYQEVSTNQLLSSYKRNALIRNLAWGLEREDFAAFLSRKCFWCDGDPDNVFRLVRTFETKEFVYNGIDRLNNEVGYTLENCVSACKICNWMKSYLTKDDFLRHIAKIHAHSLHSNI